MPTLEENLAAWNHGYDWVEEGDEWSRGWGGADAQWFGSLFPRLRNFFPAPTILEIAPGHGRWTSYLANHCERLIGVDISRTCVEICRERFESRPELEFHENDGCSLSMVDDGEADFVFSFDSLVHAEEDVISSYLFEISRTLAPGGWAFLHHSNAGELKSELEGWDRLSADEIRSLEESGERHPSHWRAMSMTAAKMREMAGEAKLSCVSQEVINWGGSLPIDCISVLSHQQSGVVQDTLVVNNSNFTAEMHSIRAAAAAYGVAVGERPRGHHVDEAG